FNEATDGGNIRTAEHGSKLENLGGLKSTEATLKTQTNGDSSKVNEAIDEISNAMANAAAEKTLKQVEGYKSKVEAGQINKDGSVTFNGISQGEFDAAEAKGKEALSEYYNKLNAKSKYRRNLADKARYDTQKEASGIVNFDSDLQTAIDKQADEAKKNLEEQTQSTGFLAKVWEGGNVPLWLDDIDRMKRDYERRMQKRYDNNAKLQNQANIAQNAQDMFKKGDFRGLAEATYSNQIELNTGGLVSSFNANHGSLQGGIQSGVSFSHNESRNYSFGTNVSGGNALAGLAMSMGMSASAYGAASSGIAAASQIAGATAMFLPGGAAGKTLANVGAIGAESTMAIGVGRANQLAATTRTSMLERGLAGKPTAAPSNAPRLEYSGSYTFSNSMFRDFGTMSGREQRGFMRDFRQQSPSRANAFERQYNALHQNPLGSNGGIVEMGIGGLGK
ncbi:hypothetical protein CQA49_09640, partial [Helicobacter sp. MIT 00-7814]